MASLIPDQNIPFFFKLNQKLNNFKQLLITIAAVVLVGCGHKSIGGYVSASSFSKKGFAKSHKQAQELRGKILKVWGYVDGLNVFPADSMDNQTGK